MSSFLLILVEFMNFTFVLCLEIAWIPVVLFKTSIQFSAFSNWSKWLEFRWMTQFHFVKRNRHCQVSTLKLFFSKQQLELWYRWPLMCDFTESYMSGPVTNLTVCNVTDNIVENSLNVEVCWEDPLDLKSTTSISFYYLQWLHPGKKRPLGYKQVVRNSYL